MKSRESQIHAKSHKLPEIRFENQQLTSFSGLLIFQVLFKRLNLKQGLKNCFVHLNVMYRATVFWTYFLLNQAASTIKAI